MTDPLVSVKMITYNHAPYIAQAIEGVLQQKADFAFELVIGEDCSTDGTREIVLDYEKKYPNIIRVITSEENVGMKKNSYRTTQACRAKYVAFCEGDDYWHHPEKLQKQVDYMETHQGCGMVHSSYDVFHQKSRKLIKDYIKYREFKMPDNPGISHIVDGIRVSFRIQTCTVILRRDLYGQIFESDPYLYQSNHFLMGDTQLWAELAAVSQIGYIPESLATYRLLDDSASRGKSKKKSYEFEISHANMMMYLCDKYKLSPSIRAKHKLIWCDYSLRLALYERNPDLALEVKKKKLTLTWKEWLRYWGARNLAFHYAYRGGAFFHNVFVKERLN